MSINHIMLVGDFLSDSDMPFTGMSGKLLRSMLSQVGINMDECYATNAFNIRLEKNDVELLCGTKAEALADYPAVKSGKYIHSIHAPHLARLYAEIASERPNVIVALGPTAAWALLQTTGIKKVRGAPSYVSPMVQQKIGQAAKVLPTYHPSGIMREWSLRPIAIADLEKAKLESEFPDLRRPERFIHVEPTVADLLEFERSFISSASALSIDIETAGEQITCVGFAPSTDRAIVVPFVDPIQKDGNYWRSIEDEVEAWLILRRWCMMTVPREKRPIAYRDLPRKPGIGQNFLYDMHRMWKHMGLMVVNEDDTMLLHHALQPEMEKSLSFLATIYTQELPWKFMRAKHETLKKEDT